MLPKSIRLIRKNSHNFFRESSFNIKKETIHCFLVPATQTTKIGIQVSKKVSKKAVERNHIKRRIRYAISSSLHNKKAPFLNLFFIAQKNIISSSYQKIYADIESIFTSFSQHNKM